MSAGVSIIPEAARIFDTSSVARPVAGRTQPSNGVSNVNHQCEVDRRRVLVKPEEGNHPAAEQLRWSILSLGVGILMASAAAVAQAAGKTVSVTEKVELAAAPSKTWDTIKDFNRWQEWHPAFASTEITMVTAIPRALFGC